MIAFYLLPGPLALLPRLKFALLVAMLVPVTFGLTSLLVHRLPVLKAVI